ncbi:MAG: glycosyltransferase family 8 protein [Clostridia bacterium]|nr:glycosyltransferase family 8 protein [Clostridia bacterium]
MKNKKEVPVFFSIDDSYAPFLSVALVSTIKNSDKNRNYKAIILYQQLSEENKQKLSKLATSNFKIEFIPILKGMESITDRKSNRLRCEYFTLTIYFRLFIAAMFPQYDKGIYIDSDIVLLGDIGELFDTDISDNFIGACYDHSIEGVEPFCKYIREAVGVDNKKYINSGVLLMNLKKLREVDFHTHFLSLLNEYHFDSVAPDQDYINAICNGNIYYLDDMWDTMPNTSRPENSDAKLIHYNLFSKPWCYDNIQYGEYFWQYAKDSGYSEYLKKHRENFTEKQIKEEKRCLENMVKRALEIINNDVTFKKVSEKGVKVRL